MNEGKFPAIFEDQSVEWFYYGRWVAPVLMHSLFLSVRKTEAYSKLKFCPAIIQVLDGRYYFLKTERERAYALGMESLQADQALFSELFSLCDENILILENLSPEASLRSVLSAVKEAFACSFAIEFIEFVVEDYIVKLCKEQGFDSTLILNLVQPVTKTPLMRFHEAVVNLKESELEDFVRKNAWVGTHGFQGNPLTLEKVRGANDEKEHGINHEASIALESLPEKIRLAVILGSKMAYYRSCIVETADRLTYSYWPVIEKLGKKYGFDWQTVTALTCEELLSLEKESAAPPKDLQKRLAGYGIATDGKEFFIVTGEKLREYESLKEDANDTAAKVDTIHGRAAYIGKVTGTVRVLLTAHDGAKLKEGDIMVVSETTPDLVPLMKIAGAIVANQGGITSHAAIVSRELKKPCIIGTKIATQVLHDGDLVEVDAGKGIVRILERK